MRKIGFIGLGVMGLPIAVNMMTKTKTTMYGFDTSGERTRAFAQAGGIVLPETRDICRDCDVLFLNLPTNAIVASTLDECLASCKGGAIVVDLGSTTPAIIREYAPRLAIKGIFLVDSPVSGGEEGAVGGTLAIMCGGDKAAFEEVKPLLQCAGSSVTYMGASGCGSIAKLANNMISGGNNIIAAEAFAFAVKAGLDPTVLMEAIKGGFAGSNVLNAKMTRVLARNFKPGARTAVHQKDIQNAMAFAKDMGVELPVTKIVRDYMAELEADGLINEDNSALAKIYEKRMGVEIKGT